MRVPAAIALMVRQSAKKSSEWTSWKSGAYAIVLQCLLNINLHSFGEVCGAVFLNAHGGVESPKPRHELEVVDRLERDVQRAEAVVANDGLWLVLSDAVDEMVAPALIIIAKGEPQNMALRERDVRLILDGASRLDLLHEVDAVRLRNREALRDGAALANGAQILAARLEVRDEPQRNGHDALAAVAEAHGAALRDAAGERVEHIIIEDARDRHVLELARHLAAGCGWITGAQALLEEVAGHADQRDIAVKGDGREQGAGLIFAQAPEDVGREPIAVAAALLAAFQEPLIRQVTEVAVQRAAADVLDPLRERPIRRDELILQERLLVEKVTAIISSTTVASRSIGASHSDCVRQAVFPAGADNLARENLQQAQERKGRRTLQRFDGIRAREVVERAVIRIALEAVNLAVALAHCLQPVLRQEGPHTRPIVLIAPRTLPKLPREVLLVIAAIRDVPQEHPQLVVIRDVLIPTASLPACHTIIPFQ